MIVCITFNCPHESSLLPASAVFSLYDSLIEFNLQSWRKSKRNNGSDMGIASSLSMNSLLF